MVLDVTPCEAVIGAVVENLSLARRPDADTVAAVEDALEHFGVLIFRDQHLTPHEQVAWSRHFGPLATNQQTEAHLLGCPEIFVVGTTTDPPVIFSPTTANGDLEWHADHMHLPVSARASMLYAREIPSVGGDTLFACMYSAHDALSPAEQESYAQMRVRHSASGLRTYLDSQGHDRSSEQLDAERHMTVETPLVRRHPRSGRRSLYFGNQVSVGISGWRNADARTFIRDLTDQSCRPEFQYRHRWRVGDALLWDNRRVLHAGTPFDFAVETRLMHRTTIEETEPI